jgi:hypothetical protein
LIYFLNNCRVKLESRRNISLKVRQRRECSKGGLGLLRDPAAMDTEHTARARKGMKRERGKSHADALLSFIVALYLNSFKASPLRPWTVPFNMAFYMLENNAARYPLD